MKPIYNDNRSHTIHIIRAYKSLSFHCALETRMPDGSIERDIFEGEPSNQVIWEWTHSVWDGVDSLPNTIVVRCSEWV